MADIRSLERTLAETVTWNKARLLGAGFVDIHTKLEPAPTVLAGADEFHEFVTSVNLRAHLARLPKGTLRNGFVDALTEQAEMDDPPFMLDYCRLNIQARHPK